MDASDLTPSRLRTFLAVARNLSFTRAAGEVHLSQPAVSRQVHLLEEALGAKLFEQRGKTVHLTDAGRALVPAAERILGDLERAMEIVPAMKEGKHARLRLGASTTPGLYVLPRALGEFHAAWPDVEVSYTVANTRRIEEAIVRNELDLGFVGAHLTSGELEIEPFARDEVVCAAHPRHRLARKGRVAPRELAGETLVLREPGSATRLLFEAWLASAGGSVGRRIELDSPEAIKAVVAGGLGVGVLPRSGLLRQPPWARLEILRIDAPPLKRPLSLVRHPGKRLTPAMEAFLAIVRRYVPASMRVAPRRSRSAARTTSSTPIDSRHGGLP